VIVEATRETFTATDTSWPDATTATAAQARLSRTQLSGLMTFVSSASAMNRPAAEGLTRMVPANESLEPRRSCVRQQHDRL